MLGFRGENGVMNGNYNFLLVEKRLKRNIKDC